MVVVFTVGIAVVFWFVHTYSRHYWSVQLNRITQKLPLQYNSNLNQRVQQRHPFKGRELDWTTKNKSFVNRELSLRQKLEEAKQKIKALGAKYKRQLAAQEEKYQRLKNDHDNQLAVQQSDRAQLQTEYDRHKLRAIKDVDTMLEESTMVEKDKRRLLALNKQLEHERDALRTQLSG